MLSTYFFIRFPVWQFLNQPIGTKHHTTILNPQQYWRRYQLDLLERCLRIDCASGDVHQDRNG